MDISGPLGDPVVMTDLLIGPRARTPSGKRPIRTPAGALFRRLLAFNTLVFLIGTAALMITPVTVSAPISLTEAAILAAGSCLMLAANAWLLRATLKPLDGLTDLMRRVDLLRPGHRLSAGSSDVTELVHTFNDMLDRLEDERNASTANALAVQEGERARIARELHDEIGQSLTAVLLGLRRTIDRAPAELSEELQRTQEMIRACLNEVGMVARRLRPGVLEDLGLVSAMHALTADFTAAGQIPVSVDLQPGLPPLGADTELVLYRIAQEGLTNVARHAHASQVVLTLGPENVPGHGNRVALTIQDDGIGTDGSIEGAGIRGMRERSILIGADLTIAPNPGGGTQLRLAVPVPVSEPRPEGAAEPSVR